jgi:hypothetical protein
MDNRQERTVAAYKRVLLHLDAHPLSPTPPLLQKTRSQLEAGIRRMEALAQQQHSARLAAQGLPTSDLSRKLRRETMMPLVRVARPLLKFAPGVERVMRVPHARSDARTVATAAMEMAKALKPHQKLLISAGLPNDFLAAMRREAELLVASTKRFENVRRVRSTATAALARELKEARKHVTVIEGILMFHQKDETTAFMWKHQRRVGARIGRPKRKKAPPPTLH